MDPEQQKKLQKQATRPFVVGGGRRSSAHGKGGGRDGVPKPTASESGLRALPAPAQVERESDELLGQVALRDEDTRSRAEIMKLLDRREKDAEELELESCFSDLRQRAAGGASGTIDDEIDSLAGQSLTDLKEMQEMQGLYR